MNYSEVLKEVGAVLGLSSESKVTDEDRKKWREKSEQLQRDQEQKEEKERLLEKYILNTYLLGSNLQFIFC